MTDLFLIPDVEALVSQYLRSRTEITDLIDDAVYTVLPASPPYPCIRVHQFTSDELTVGWLDRAAVQVDIWGGSKALASDIGRIARSVLGDMTGTFDEGVVTGVRTSGWRYEPDETFPTAKPRFLFVADIAVHPSRTGS